MKNPFSIVPVLLLVGIGNASAAEIDFNRDIRPILSDNCFLCHGPSESTREADLRLDDRQSAIDSGMLVAGQPDESEVIARVFAEDADLLMPPPDSNKRLTDAQRTLLKQWVAQGATYQEHWAFVPPQKAPGVDTANPVDHFIGKRLREHGLTFSPPADLRTLIRRVSLDLTGMAPTPEQVEQFLASADSLGVDLAYEALVDRLLASADYGERMTLAWLDAARYGDTSVMHADGPRDMWPWRDWVIDAYNANMPFDQFTIEQIAGDLIPDATVDQKVASGFNRNHATSDEGGAFAEELRVEYVVDRVQTTSTVWLALTMECAQCHDHKYDPISQTEYYQFYAYFNNTADPGMQTRKGNQSPVVDVYDQRHQARMAELQAEIDSKKKQLESHQRHADPQFVAWAEQETAKYASDAQPTEQLSGIAHWFPLDESDGSQLKNETTGAVAVLEKGKFQTSDREGNKALKLNGQTQFACSENPPQLESDQPFTMAAWIKFDGKSGGAVFSRMNVADNYRGYDMWIQGKNIGTHIIHSWSDNAVKVVSKDSLKTDTWQHVVITYDGTQKAAGVKIYIDGKLSANQVEADTLGGTLQTDVPFKIGSRSNGANWKGEVDDIRIYPFALSESEVPLAKGDVIGGILATAADDRSEAQWAALRNVYFSQDADFQSLRKSLAATTKQHADLAAKKTTSMIMADNPDDKMRMTFVLDRGQYDSPKKDAPVSPGVPAALPPLAEDAPPNRLGLARWLTAPDHPLTARVAVNRYWTMLFGNGLVRTISDFGAQGMPPTHPQLLDWLAVDFVQSGWDVKRMLRQLVLSRTYRQSSRREPVHAEQDPENLLLAHSPRFRLQGELIRDQALAVSGLLTRQVGGPGVKPYQPVNIWNEVSLNGGLRYTQDKGEKLYRKSMYTYWKRSAPMPNMMIFDAPSREKCVVARARTNTPLQALVTLNDPQFVEAARALAQRLIESESDDRKRIDLAYRLTTARPASERETSVLLSILADQRERFAAAPESANQFLSVGELPRDESIDAIQHAAWTVIAQMILNLDETLTRG
ncbi:Planctomycete cytochrome C [Stieleria neptunia]|uniref:Planctomycete cytochrome C n=1 Tax=Stieleria neptunia TaxID=2527979 RepID=A0A518HM58_9BACT|nr:DUF1553 domain-containing protein [Stieleria neptunia]QDV41941.1 Planctomycete cytochrome C [Stieleria neptunia]